MAENTKIAWCDHTFNPWVGCSKVSPGCDHCYAESWAKRTGNGALWAGERRLTKSANWDQPRRWEKQARAEGRRARVFCASLADVFDNQVSDEWRRWLWWLTRDTPTLDWLILTKRPQNIAKMLPADWGAGYANVWLGVTAENQEEADRRIPILLSTPAAVRFVSYEPAIGPVDFSTFLPATDSWCEHHGHEFSSDDVRDPCVQCGYERDRTYANWIIVGGESGPGARPFDVAWARSTVEQCKAAGVACFVKQLGAKPHEDGCEPGHVWRGGHWPQSLHKLVDRKGGDITEWPADLRVQEWPR